MSMQDLPESGPDIVEVTENFGEWFVRVVRNGKSHVSTFEIEAYARAFADGQRMGLKLDALTAPGKPEIG